MIVYIAGPMSGVPQWNYPLFFDTEGRLEDLGHEALNPARNDGIDLAQALRNAGDPSAPKRPWDWYMRRDLPQVCDADAVCVLPGWQKSKGARLEVQVAQTLGIPVMCLVDEDGGDKLVPRLRLIAISGYGRSGKDSVAGFLVEHGGYTQTAIVNLLQRSLLALNPVLDAWEFAGSGDKLRVADVIGAVGWEGAKSHRHGPEIIRLLQMLGSEAVPELVGDDIWLTTLLDSLPDGGKYVLSSTRRRCEAEVVKALGGSIWRVSRTGVGPRNGHGSETALDDWDFDVRIENCGSLDQLEEVVTVALRLMEAGVGRGAIRAAVEIESVQED